MWPFKKKIILNDERVMALLAEIKDPVLGRNLVESQRVGDILIRADQSLFVSLVIPPRMATLFEPVRDQVQKFLHQKLSLSKVDVVLVSQRSVESDEKKSIPGVKNIIAVASGKGGVGKSTVAALIAYGFKNQGFKVGILDADIYGPSQPQLLSLSGKVEADSNGLMLPHEKEGLKCHSIGFMVNPDQAVVWRGAMIQKALLQLLFQTNWGELDYLIIDLPPGTGDIQLTLSQKVKVSGAVIVSTSHKLAQLDAEKAISMFQRVDIPIMGLIENMSYYMCKKCGDKTHLFEDSSLGILAEKYGLPILAEIPLDPILRENLEKGIRFS